MTRNVKILLVGVGLALLLGYMIHLTMSGNKVTCEVCIEFNGATRCERAAAKDAHEAQTAAASTACSLLSGGVTEGINCRNTTPKSVSCQEHE